MNLAKYRSHKIVEAGRMVEIAIPKSPDGKPLIKVEQADGSIADYEADPKLFARGFGKPGDYLVRYEDGYVAWSPRQPFEDGYTRIDA